MKIILKKYIKDLKKKLMLNNKIKFANLILLFFIIPEYAYAINYDNSFSALCSFYSSKNNIMGNEKNIDSTSRNFDWGFGLNYNIAIQPERTFFTINSGIGSETILISKGEELYEKQEINFISISPIGLTLQTDTIVLEDLSLIFYTGLHLQLKYANKYTQPSDSNFSKYISSIRKYGANLNFRVGANYLLGEYTSVQIGIDFSIIPFFNSIKNEVSQSDISKKTDRQIKIFTSKIGGYILIGF